MQKPHYLSLALDDLKGIVRYIANELEAPKATENFIIKIDKEVNKLTKNPYRCHVYITAEKLKHEYRVLHVNNYSIFYVAENEKIEIHRVIYSKRNIQQLLSEQIK